MNLKNAMAATLAILAAGCAAGPGTPTRNAESADQGRACLEQARRHWERDVIESLRWLRRGAELRDAECARQYLAHAETATVNQSQRVYARLFVEGLLRRGPIIARDGQDIRGELYYQLCWAWRYTAPCSPAKMKQVLEAMLESGADAEQRQSAFIVQMIRETGLRPAPASARSQEIHLMAGEHAAEPRRWLQVPLAGERRETGDWTTAEACAWGGGSDRLLTGTNVLAFLVTEQGEPSFRGNHLWIVNLGASPVYLTSLAAAQNNHELTPGRDELLPLVSAEPTTGIPLQVRYRRTIR